MHWTNTNQTANANITVTQTATFGAYAIAAKLNGSESFSAAKAITAISILNVMISPLSFLLGNIPSSFSAFGCFKRIQEFLLLDERIDGRDIRSGSKEQVTGMSPDAPSMDHDSIELHNTEPKNDDATSSVEIVDGNFSWGEKPILRNITTSLPQTTTGSLTIVVGPVGSGKSTFLKAILGETASSTGVVSTRSKSVAFCDQTPWVMNTSIRDNIVAESKGFEESWFNTVVEACDLAVDLARFPAGASTVVGDKGLKLSGGQKQRIVSPATHQLRSLLTASIGNGTSSLLKEASSHLR